MPNANHGESLRQQVAHVGHRLRRRRLAPGDAEANLEHARALDVAVLQEALGQQQVAGLEHFELRHHAGVLDGERHGLQVRRRVDEHAVAHVERAHVERADVGLDLDHVLNALGRPAELGIRARLRRVFGVVVEPRAGAGGQVDQHVRILLRGCDRPSRRKAPSPCWAWWSWGRARGCARSRRRPWRRRGRSWRSARASPARPGSCRACPPSPSPRRKSSLFAPFQRPPAINQMPRSLFEVMPGRDIIAGSCSR